MKIVFFGTPLFAKEFLEALHADQDISVSGVVTQADKPMGRKKILTSPATKKFALENDIPVFQPTKLKDPEFLSKLSKLEPDLFVIVAYGKIVPDEILNIPKLGSINVHPSKLPKYRGPSPMQAAIAAGDKSTAVSIMLIDDKMDHGPLLSQIDIDLVNDETPESLTKKVVKVGAPALIDSLKKYVAGDLKPKEQDHEKATICKLLSKEDGKIDWSEPAKIIEQKLRAYTPWPGVWTVFEEKTIKILAASPSQHTRSKALCYSSISGGGSISPGEVKIIEKELFVGTGTSPIKITELQLEGKQKTTAEVFLNGYKQIDGQKLG